MNIIGQNGNDGLHYDGETEKVVEVNKADAGHSIVTIPKAQEDIYLDQPTKPDGGRTPNPVKKKINNL